MLWTHWCSVCSFTGWHVFSWGPIPVRCPAETVQCLYKPVCSPTLDSVAADASSHTLFALVTSPFMLNCSSYTKQYQGEYQVASGSADLFMYHIQTVDSVLVSLLACGYYSCLPAACGHTTQKNILHLKNNTGWTHVLLPIMPFLLIYPRKVTPALQRPLQRWIYEGSVFKKVLSHIFLVD